MLGIIQALKPDYRDPIVVCPGGYYRESVPKRAPFSISPFPRSRFRSGTAQVENGGESRQP